MRVLLDTSVLIDHLRGFDEATAYLAEARSQGDELWSVTVVRTEVLAGMLPKEEKQTLAFLAEIGWLDVDQALADLAGDMARQYVKSHPGVDTVDYLFAASVEALEAELATTNLKHFPMFSGLKKPH
jgi:predicted nucleic acid-binding protein